MLAPNSSRLSLRVVTERWPLSVPFRITGYTFEELEVVVAYLDDGEHVGRGEAVGVYYLGDRAPEIAAAIEAVRDAVEAGIDREALQQLLPRGGARNALDCALWELEARRAGKPVHELAGIDGLKPLLTTYTIGADTPEFMAERAKLFAEARALKLKLIGDGADAARIEAVRAARPDVWLGVDANQAFTREALDALMPTLIATRVELLEQPFPRDQDHLLDGLGSPIEVAADESVQTVEDIAAQVGRAQAINIKLDKCGGLTAALAMVVEARRLGLKTMVGNMVGTGLAMAPAFVIGQLCDYIDLDGPLLLKVDRDPGAVYTDGYLTSADAGWGQGA